MPTAAETINEIIANALVTANTSTESAQIAADDLIRSNAGYYITPPTTSSGFNVEAVEPEIPTVEDSTYNYQAERDALIALLSNQLAEFFATYYPLASDAFDEATNWLVNTITNGGTGIPAALEDQIIQRERDRIIREGQRVSASITSGYAARGFSLVQGPMIYDLNQATFEQAGRIGIATTTVAVKQIEIAIETIKFAIKTTIDSRMAAMQAATDYIRALSVAPDAASKIAALNTDIKAKMMSAAADWYRARQNRDQLILESKLAELNAGIDIYKHRRENATQNSQIDVQALAAAADVFAKTAQAALASLNSVVSQTVSAFE
jgi:hypothetical protein